MATIMARTSPSLRCSSNYTRRGCSAPGPAKVVSFHPRTSCRPHAFYRNGWNAWDGNSADAMKAFEDMAKQWTENGAAVGGGFFWPGGGYVYGSQSCKPHSSTTKHDSKHKHGSTAAGFAGPHCPRLLLDVADTGDFYLLFADVPGLAKSDLSIKLSKERVLKIAGERKAPWHVQDSPTGQQQQGSQQESESATDNGKKRLSPLRQERVVGAFERSWELPEDADTQGISAKVTEGVLTITVPKKQPQPEVDDSEDIFIS